MDNITERIQQLKAERNAVILAHNYQPAEIQEIADMLGDSLELSRLAAGVDAQVIVFCGVTFMAETAAILNPEKTVLLPRLDAGCPMADMITAPDLLKVREQHLGVPIVTYVNTTAAVKAESDLCCTSANAIKVVESLTDAGTVYMAPDKNLAQYAARHTDKKVLHWNGFCPIHNNLTADDIAQARAKYPGAKLLAHPECRPEVLEMADGVFSTSGMLKYVAESSHDAFIIATEVGILHPMAKAAPGKKLYPASPRMICADMKKTSLEDVVTSLETLQPRITVPEETRVRALAAVERMLAI